jgi:pimeloyl-ACP methyl ester carboxylesterase
MTDGDSAILCFQRASGIINSMEPISHFYYSHRLKLQFWDFGTEGKPTLILVHGGLDHARNWDWVARSLREHFHVYALDLRGHGNSQQAPGALYTLAEHVLDLSALVDVINDFPVYLVGHSLGGNIVLHYSGIYADRVKKLVAIEGLGFPMGHKFNRPFPDRLREWVENVRKGEKREVKSYPNLESAVARMQEVNPHLPHEIAEHLTRHGTNWNSDGSLTWKFDNYLRFFSPYGTNKQDLTDILSNITCPALLFWGRESFFSNPEESGLAQTIKDYRLVAVEQAGHWLHHDQLDLFLAETTKFLLA